MSALAASLVLTLYPRQGRPINWTLFTDIHYQVALVGCSAVVAGSSVLFLLPIQVKRVPLGILLGAAIGFVPILAFVACVVLVVRPGMEAGSGYAVLFMIMAVPSLVSGALAGYRKAGA
jgi:hypothetical protein